MKFPGWYNSRKKAFFIFMSITLILIISAFKIELGYSSNYMYDVFTVEFDYYGMDADKIEALITIPLEQELSALEGLLEIKSSVEYGKSSTTVYFTKSNDSDNTYLEIRNIVDSVYEKFPLDVQRPRIYSSDSDARSIICLAFTGLEDNDTLREFLESGIKKKLEAIEGVAQVMISGGSQKEVLVAFDPEKSAAALQNPSDFASIIQDGNSVTSGTRIKNDEYEKNIIFDTKLHSALDIKTLPVKISENYSQLQYLATINTQPRIQDEIVRVNGEKAVSISIKAASGGNNIKISRKCMKILQEADLNGINWKVLYDLGSIQFYLIKSVLVAFIQSLLCVLIIIPLFFKSLRTTVLMALFLITDSLWTVGCLSLLGFTLNQNTLAGISIALGLVADSALVISDCSESSSSESIFHMHFSRMIPALVSAGFTTLLVLLPLFLLDDIVSGTRNIAVTICIMVLVSMFLAFVFLPCFIYGTKTTGKRIQKITERNYIRLGYVSSIIALKKNRFILSAYIFMIVAPLFIFFFSGKNITLDERDCVLYCSADYESNISPDYIDKQIIPFVDYVLTNEMISFIRNETRKGSVEFEVGFSSMKDKDSVVNFLASCSTFFPDAFYYVPQSGHGQKNVSKIEMAVIGDDSKLCRSYAEKAVQRLGKLNITESAVLNFKNNESEIDFIPGRVLLAKNGLNIQNLASTLRWFMFGPVADKWIQDGKEYDIRIAGENLRDAKLTEIENLHIPTQNSSVRLISLGDIVKTDEIGKIYRKDGRRCAYFTVEMKDVSTDAAMKVIRDELKKVEMEKGYGFSFSKDLETLAYKYNLIFAVFILSVTGILLLVTGLTENAKKSLLIISIIPVTLFLPLAIKFFMKVPLELGDIIGMIILSGITVNNSIYIAESGKKRIEFKIREKIKSIAVTSITTILSAVPLYIFASDSFSRGLAFFMIFGIVNSLAASLLLFPAVLSINKFAIECDSMVE